MKKVVSIILFVILVIVSLNVKAVSENGSTVNMSFTKTVEEDKVVIKISLGEFVSVEENSVMASTMTLDFDNNVISKVSGTSSNNWDITIQESTKRVLLETDSARPNTEIAEITFNINPNASEGTSSVGLKEINIAASASGLDEYYNDQTVSFSVNEETPTNPGGNENEVTGGNNAVNNATGNNAVGNNTIGNNVIGNNSTGNRINQTTNNSSNRTNSIVGNRDNTIATGRLPDTGIQNILIIAIVVTAICIVIFKIKSRKIKY